MILGGRGIGASSRTEASGATADAAGLSTHVPIRARAAGPPAIASTSVANPAPFRLTTLVSINTPGSLAPSRTKVTNFIGGFGRTDFVLYHYLWMNPLEQFSI